MADRSFITDDSVLIRWMRLELGKMNEGLVAERKTLYQLLTEKNPSSRTKSGKEYFFDQRVLTTLQEQLPEDIHQRLKLPVFFYLDSTVPDSGFLSDETAVAALQALGEISTMRRPEKGRLWVSRPIVYAIMEKYPTAVQLVMR